MAERDGALREEAALRRGAQYCEADAVRAEEPPEAGEHALVVARDLLA